MDTVYFNKMVGVSWAREIYSKSTHLGMLITSICTEFNSQVLVQKAHL